jgi:hypothetical protein
VIFRYDQASLINYSIISFFLENEKSMVKRKICEARRPEKVAGLWHASAAVDDLFLNFLFLFFSRKKENKKK